MCVERKRRVAAFSKERTQRALINSLYTVIAVQDGRTVGMGRLIGDGMYYMIADIVVQPNCQKHGIGSRIINMLTEYVDKETPIGGRSSKEKKYFMKNWDLR